MLPTGVKLLCAIPSHIDGNANTLELVTLQTHQEEKVSASGLHGNTVELHLQLLHGTECQDSRRLMLPHFLKQR
jgi:hypothetical protein